MDSRVRAAFDQDHRRLLSPGNYPNHNGSLPEIFGKSVLLQIPLTLHRGRLGVCLLPRQFEILYF